MRRDVNKKHVNSNVDAFSKDIHSLPPIFQLVKVQLRYIVQFNTLQFTVKNMKAENTVLKNERPKR
jgi:hypothetical protein